MLQQKEKDKDRKIILSKAFFLFFLNLPHRGRWEERKRQKKNKIDGEREKN